ncbi:MAG: hypothetical protein Q8K79_17230 [Solirubrobacteraceae bacterium]|nr:hypothetical protein [Solirubrobacteraceae bacterium]
MGHVAVTVDERQHGARRERPQDDLETEVLGQRREGDEHDDRAAHADLRGRVLEAVQVLCDAARALGLRDDEIQRHAHRRQRADQQQRRGRATALAGEQQRQQDDRAEVGDRPARDDVAAQRRGDLAGILEHRDDHAQRRRREDDRDEQRRLHESPGLERVAERDGDRERRKPRERRELEHAAAQLLELDLQAGEEQQEDQADERDDGDRRVDLDPAEHRRADDDPQDDLQHDGRQPQTRQQSERERHGEGHRHDDQQAGEARRVHARAVCAAARSLRARRPAGAAAPLVV